MSRAPTRLSLADRWALPLGLIGVSAGLPPLVILWRNPDFIRAHGLTTWDLLMLVVLATVALPLLLHLSLAWLDRASGRDWGWLSGCFLACWLFQLPLLRSQPLAFAVPAGVVGALLAVKVLLDWPRVRRAVTYLVLVVWLGGLCGLFMDPNVVGATDPVSEPSDFTQLEFERRETPIVVLLFDELPLTVLLDGKGNIDRRHFPYFAELADFSTWYRATRSVSGETVTAVPAILRGLREASRGESLLTLFRQSHHCVVSDDVIVLAPPSGQLELWRVAGAWRDLSTVLLHAWAPAELVGSLPAIDQGWVGFSTQEDRREKALASFEGLQASTDKPLFFFAHNLLPHGPYRYREGGVLSAPSRLPENGKTPFDSVLATFFLQAKMTDELLGEAMQNMRREGLWDECLLIVLADHGRTFEPGIHARSVEGRPGLQTLYVPLFVKLPGQKKGRLVDQEISTLDVLPLLVSLLEGRAPWTLEGKVPLSEGTASSTLPDLLSLAAEKYNRYELSEEASVYCTPELAAVWSKPAPPTSQPSLARYTLLNESLLASVDLASPELPLSLEARVEGTLSEQAQLAWVLNGVVAAVVRRGTPGPLSEPFYLSTPVPRRLLRAGANSVELMEVIPGKDPWKRLARVETTRYRLHGATVTWNDGRDSLPIAPARGGTVTSLPLARGGWSLRVDSVEPGNELLLFDRQGDFSLSLPADKYGSTLVLTLPAGAKPADYRVFLRTPNALLPLEWGTF